MKSISEFLSAARKEFLDVAVRYVHPTLYVVVMHGESDVRRQSHREQDFMDRLVLSRSEFEDVLARLGIALVFARDAADLDEGAYSFLAKDSPSFHWLPLFDDQIREEWSNSLKISVSDSGPRAIHFYGFKGGQARSTVLLMLAKSLEKSGYNVLLVDVDLEAPSLASALSSESASIESSLLGLIRGCEPEPVAVHALADGGRIDLIAAAPSVAGIEMDYAAMLLQVTTDPDQILRAVQRLRNSTKERLTNYDFVLFDHRTGLSTTVLPVISAWPGSVVISSRDDGSAAKLHSVIETLFAANPDFPGAFVYFSLDPERKRGSLSEGELQLRERFLTILGNALERGQENAGEVDLVADDLRDYFVPWYHDRAFLGVGVPELPRISRDNQDSLDQLRQVLGVPAVPERVEKEPRVVLGIKPGTAASPSGALDQGLFVETPGAARVLQPNLPSFYVFGRKGTGKTRLFREMFERGLGFPLHSAADFSHGGLQSQSGLAKALISKVESNLELFWWTLLSAALESEHGGSLTEMLERYLEDASFRGIEAAKVAGQLAKRKDYFTFLIDGVETAVEASKTGELVESLFRFLSTLQNDAAFSGRVRFRLFIRSDLPVGIQNIEQQIHGRRVDLRWDESSIFHYVLAEIARNSWFRQHFQDTCATIESNQAKIRAAALSAKEYESLLLEVFPQKLRRNNLLTMTFFRTYFSDAAGEGHSRSSFYPRVFGSFLQQLAITGAEQPSRALDVDGRVSHAVVLEAFVVAAKAFISEVQQELAFALDLSDDPDKNRRLVKDLTQAFAGLTTPFVLDGIVRALGERVPSEIRPDGLRESLRRMKDMGIFEDHPSDPSRWRAGRLFKEGLGMKYVRKVEGRI